MEWKLEVVVVPVSDVDRAKAFYAEQLGFHVDVDDEPMPGFRVVQLTAPGSACSVTIGPRLTDMRPGSLKGLQFVVDDIDAARAEIVGRGVQPSEVFHFGPEGRTPGKGGRWNSFFDLADPDGNVLVVQERARE